MKYSMLKHELEVMKLNHKHELEMLKMKQEQEEKALIATCKHTWEDGSSARGYRGVQWDSWYECEICGRRL